MSQKIIEKCEDVMAKMQTPEHVASFVRAIVLFECFEKTHHFKKKYKETLNNVSDVTME